MPVSILAIRTRNPTPPGDLQYALRHVFLRYTAPVAIYFFLPWGFGGGDLGVFGDGENGAYEWFTWSNGDLETSDAAYGDSAIALRDVLNRVFPT